MKIDRYKIVSIFSISLLLLLWYGLTLKQSNVQALLFPSLSKMILSLINNYDIILTYSLITLYRVVVGLILGLVSGLMMGFLIVSNKYLEAIVDPVIEIIRPIPPIAITPFFILWFGLGDEGQLLLVGLGCFMVIVVSTVNAIRNVNDIYVRAAKSLGANQLDVYWTIYLPAIMPSISSAVRVSAATGFGLTVAAEYLGAQGGLGYFIRNARVTLNTESVMLAAIILGASSLFIDFLIRKIFHKLTRWNKE